MPTGDEHHQQPGKAKARAQAEVMERDRSFLSDLLGAALRGDGGTVQRMVVRYASEQDDGGGEGVGKDGEGSNEGDGNTTKVVTPRDVLAQFRDGRGRTALHFACQSVPEDATKGDEKEESGEKGRGDDDGGGEHKDGDDGPSSRDRGDGGAEPADDRDDIVHELLLSDWAEENHILTDPTPTPDTDGGGDVRSGNGSGDHGGTGSSTGIGIVRAKDTDGLTPLMLASQLSRRSRSLSDLRVRSLLDAAERACPSSSSSSDGKIALARSKDGATALHYASGAGASRDTINALYNAGRIAARTFSKHSGTPLHWAAGEGEDRTETMSALIDDCGADVDAADRRGITPLILAAAAGNDGNAAMLVRAGADRGRVLEGNVTVYHVAADMNLVDTLRALLERDDQDDGGDDGGTGMTVSEKCCAMRDENGRTPLDLAADGGHVDCVMLLLDPQRGRGDEAAARAFIEERRDRKDQREGDGGGGGGSIDSPPASSLTIGANVGGTSATGDGNDDQDVDDVDRIESEAKIRAAELLSLKEESSGSSTSESARSTTAVGHKEEGNRLYRAGRLEEAIHEYTAAIDVDPTDATFYSNRSACLASLDRYHEALSDAVVARNLDPRWSKGCFRLATARLGLGRYEDAAVAAWEGVQLDPENEELQRLLRRSVQLGKREHRARTKGAATTEGSEGGDGDGGKKGGLDSSTADEYSDLVEQ